MLTYEKLEEARQIFKEEEKRRRMEKKRLINEAQKIKNKMSIEEKIEFLNTPYIKCFDYQSNHCHKSTSHV